MKRYNEAQDMKPYTSMEEIELVQHIICGDHEAFKYLVLFYETQLLAYLQHLLGDRESARDIAQETFVSAFYALPNWKPLQSTPTHTSKQGNTISSKNRTLASRPLAPWLYRIATNRALTLLKKRSKYTFLPLSEAINDVGSYDIGNEEMIENQYIRRELLREALGLLSEEDATCIILRFALNEKYIEIAEQLGITEEAVRKRISRGIAAIRTYYHQLEEEYGRNY